jgi:hypothetical protein
MIIRYIFLIFICTSNFQGNLNVRYHELEFTTSDPIISKRCADMKNHDYTQSGFVKETYDSFGRCLKLEFFQKAKPYEAVDFPSMLKYVWTDSCLTQTLCNWDGELFSKEEMVMPNKIEYILRKSKVVMSKNYFNNRLIDTTNYNFVKIEDADYFMMYSGCEIKYNSNYRIKF